LGKNIFDIRLILYNLIQRFMKKGIRSEALDSLQVWWNTGCPG